MFDGRSQRIFFDSLRLMCASLVTFKSTLHWSPLRAAALLRIHFVFVVDGAANKFADGIYRDNCREMANLATMQPFVWLTSGEIAKILFVLSRPLAARIGCAKSCALNRNKNYKTKLKVCVSLKLSMNLWWFRMSWALAHCPLASCTIAKCLFGVWPCFRVCNN